MPLLNLVLCIVNRAMKYSIPESFIKIHCTVQYSTVKYSTVQCSTVQYSTVQYSTVLYCTVQWSDAKRNKVTEMVIIADRHHFTALYSRVPFIELYFAVHKPTV